VSAENKLLGAGALVMALCCAVLPLAGAALGGGLIGGAGTLGVVAGCVLLAGLVVLLWRRRGSAGRC
jgi:hypothetical protein